MPKVVLRFIVLVLIFMLFPFFAPVSAAVKKSVLKWDFARIDELRSAALVNEGSVSIVVGLDEASTSNYGKLLNLVQRHGGMVTGTISLDAGQKAIVVDIPIQSAASFVFDVQVDVSIDYLEPNLKSEAYLIPNDYYWSLQWASSKIGADYAWNRTVGNSSLLVAVVDTGVDFTHSDLLQNYVALGYDWVNRDNNPMDDNGHGTHVAGIIAATLNNSLGVAGLAQVSLMAEKSLDSTGEGFEAQLADGIIDAVDKGARIISMSWGSSENSNLIHKAIQYAYNHNVLLIAAAGNERTEQKNYPAAYSEVIAVTATDQNDSPAYFTDYGSWVELAAPGVEIYSTLRGGSYGYMSGTSMAAPQVTGVAALVWSKFPQETRDDVRARLRDTADDLGEPGFDVYYGYGRVNARKALESGIHDVRLTNVTSEKSIVGKGFDTEIHANIMNQGTSSENISLALFANDTFIGTCNASLQIGDSEILNFTWNTGSFPIGKYALKARLGLPTDEVNVSNATYEGNMVAVTIPGDVDGNGDVNILDMIRITSLYGEKRGTPLYLANCDLDNNGEITFADYLVLIINYGERYP